jgi:hypothetical protein
MKENESGCEKNLRWCYNGSKAYTSTYEEFGDPGVWLVCSVMESS